MTSISHCEICRLPFLLAVTLWNGNECGKSQGNENLKETIQNAEYQMIKTAAESGIFRLFG
jgi:hypothetical protein